jgi:hypothetical protein
LLKAFAIDGSSLKENKPGIYGKSVTSSAMEVSKTSRVLGSKTTTAAFAYQSSHHKQHQHRQRI